MNRIRMLIGAFALVSTHALAGQDAPVAPVPARVEEAARLLGRLIETYGVAGAEEPVRKVILNMLPSWAKPEVDSAGNIWVRAGRGKPTSVFVAHMDETGFEVTAIADDGLLTLRPRGGFLPWLWEATPALVHTGDGRTIPGVFTPRVEPEPSPTRRGTAYKVDVGMKSRAAAESLGVRLGQTVTNPKRFVRLAGLRATGRSFDDRVGSVAQVLALRQLDPSALTHEVVFLWVVQEEVGLVGSGIAAQRLGFSADRVYAIDTFVSADSPLDPTNFAVAPIGEGPVARMVDNSSVTPTAVVDSLVALARARRLPLQVGTTNGGNDGSVFASWGVVDIPIGWPLRYSHSPVEVIDLRDVVSLGDLIAAIATGW